MGGGYTLPGQGTRRMHEMSIAVELMGQLEAVAAANGMVRIEEVFVTAGALRAIVPEAFELAFAAVSGGTCAEGARLRLETVTPRARCRQCGGSFAVSIDMFICPDCNLADVELIEGNDIILTSVTGHRPEGEDDED